jgi:transcriptional regulator NrdR family protein
VGPSVDIIKQGGARDSERFLRQKLHASIVSACQSVGTPVGQSEAIAHAVCDSVISWLEDKQEVTSVDLRKITAKHLQVHHPDAAYMYEQYQITI